MTQTNRFTEYYREVESGQVNVQEEILRLLGLSLVNVRTSSRKGQMISYGVNLLHLPEYHLVQPIGLWQITSFIFLDQLKTIVNC
jgi:hypothetical protein